MMNMFKKSLAAIALLLLLTGGVGAQNNLKSAMDTQTESRVAEAGPVVEIETTMGPVKIKLYDDTPLHRDNFLKLAREGYYDGVLFHRVIKDFMVQAGDPESKEAPAGKSLGSGDPGYTLPAEINYPRHYHKYGALAAARTGDQVNPERRSSGSQFYIVTGRKVSPAQMRQIEGRQGQEERQRYFNKLCKENMATIDSLRKSGMKDELEQLRLDLIRQTEEAVKVEPLPANIAADYTTIGGTPHLDGQYTVFGEVLEGMDVIEKIQNSETGAGDRPKEDIRIISMKVEEDRK